MSEKQNDQKQATQKAWDEWHASVCFADEDGYVPAMSPLWRIAFSAGATWALEQVEE